MTDEPDFYCTAYGPPPDGVKPAVWPRCFLRDDAAIRDAHCTTRAACREAMDAERQRVWQRIHELAAAGDAAAVWLAGEFPTPGGLLGGTDR